MPFHLCLLALPLPARTLQLPRNSDRHKVTLRILGIETYNKLQTLTLYTTTSTSRIYAGCRNVQKSSLQSRRQVMILYAFTDTYTNLFKSSPICELCLFSLPNCCLKKTLHSERQNSSSSLSYTHFCNMLRIFTSVNQCIISKNK